VQQRGAPDLFCLDLKLPDTNGVSGVHRGQAGLPERADRRVLVSPRPPTWKTPASRPAPTSTSRSPPAPGDGSRPARPADGRVRRRNLDAPAANSGKLSKRQKQLIAMLDQGHEQPRDRHELEISEHTVKVHLWRLFRRLGVKSRTQALHYARTNGLLSG
jgi:DNA-binding CsgD family transcriptional regulator